MNIGFWCNQMCERGTEAATFDYAYFNEKLLGNLSYIFYDKNNKNNKEGIIKKFKKEFTVIDIDVFDKVDTHLIKYNITHFYSLRSGEYDPRLSKVAKNCIHCVFNCSQPHGEIYASISPWVYGNNNKYPSVPHMINLPKHNKNMKEILNIPEKSVIFGGYGGKCRFNIKFVQETVYKIAKQNPNIYFLFANFDKFCSEIHNIIHLPPIYDLAKKVEFINTCDAMIWARDDGETFGLAIAEFSSMNKPVISMKIGVLAHYYLLGDKGIWYSNQTELENIILNFNPEIEKNKDWNAYKDYTPEKVMNIFKEVFLEEKVNFIHKEENNKQIVIFNNSLYIFVSVLLFTLFFMKKKRK